jgi:hypothetical protein
VEALKKALALKKSFLALRRVPSSKKAATNPALLATLQEAPFCASLQEEEGWKLYNYG